MRETPIVGFGPDGDGVRTPIRLDEDALVQLVSAGYWYPGLWRDLPAAIRAANDGDTAPILRLAAETVVIEAGASAPQFSSEALYLAVICHDYPQLWDAHHAHGGARRRGPAADRGLPGRHLRSLQRRGLDRDGLRRRPRLPPLAVAGAA